MTPEDALDVLVEATYQLPRAEPRIQAVDVLRELVEAWSQALTGPRPLAVGDVLTDEAGAGFCGGMFGRDSYATKTVEAVGPDWVVAREEYGQAVFCHRGPEHLIQYRRPE